MRRLDRPKCTVERVGELLGSGLVEDQGRTDLEDVGVRSIDPDEHTRVSHPVDNGIGLRGGGLAGRTIPHEVHPDEQTGTAHVADQRALVGKAAQPGAEQCTNTNCIGLESFCFQHIEHREQEVGEDDGRFLPVGDEVDWAVTKFDP